MIGADLFSRVERVLCVAAHPDDIEIGAGVTVRRLIERGVDVRWVVLTADGDRRREVVASAFRYLLPAEHLDVCDFSDGRLPYDQPSKVKDTLVDHRSRFVPDLVIAPRRDDAHQDHRFVAELVWQLYRGTLVLEYEIPKYDGDLGAVNVFVEADAEEVRRKIDDLFAAYPSQSNKPWFDEDLLQGLMRIRGVEAAAASGYAEGFVARKLVVG